MSLTWKQKHNVKTLIWCIITLFIVGGGVFGVFCLVTWSDTATSIQHACSGTTGFTIINTHGDGQSVTAYYDDPKCKVSK